jgi:hypothetical protein
MKRAQIADVVSALFDAQERALAEVGAHSGRESRRLACQMARQRREARWRWILRNTARTDQRPTDEEVAGAVVLPRYRHGEGERAPVDVAPTSDVDARATVPVDAPAGGLNLTASDLMARSIAFAGGDAPMGSDDDPPGGA